MWKNKRGSHFGSFVDVLFLVSGFHGVVGDLKNFGEARDDRPLQVRSYNLENLSLSTYMGTKLIHHVRFSGSRLSKSTCVRSPSEHKHVGISMYVCMHPSNVCMCPRNACIPPVTAAYATITSRLGVVVIRLLAAAFWLGVESRCYCRRKTDRRLNLVT